MIFINNQSVSRPIEERIQIYLNEHALAREDDMQAENSEEVDLGSSEEDDDRPVEDLRQELLDEVDSEGVEDDNVHPLPRHEYSLQDLENDHPLPPYIAAPLPHYIEPDLNARNEYHIGGPLPPHIIEVAGHDSDDEEVRREDSEDEENLPAIVNPEMPGDISDSEEEQGLLDDVPEDVEEESNEEEQGLWINNDLEFIPINAYLDRVHFPVFRPLLGTWEFDSCHSHEEQTVSYVTRSQRGPHYTSHRDLADEELLQEIHDKSGCSYCGGKNCNNPVHQAARHSKDMMLDREVNWRQKTISGEVCGNVVHCVSDCAMFGDKYVFHNNMPVGAVVHSEHCLHVDKERMRRIRKDQIELEVRSEQDRLKRLKRKVITKEGTVYLESDPVISQVISQSRSSASDLIRMKAIMSSGLEINKEEIKWKYSKTEISQEVWGDDTVRVPKSSICDMNSIRQVWDL